MSDQTQKAGDNSTNIQTGSITVHQGLSLSEVRQLALDVFRANFFELAGEAKHIARQRAEEVTENFLKKLQEQHSAGLKQAQEPDFQHALYTVQKEYARCGDKELGDLLVDLLVDRTKHESRTILQIVLNESLLVAPKLTPDQLAVLSVIFLFKYTINHGIKNHETLWEYLDRYVGPFAALITEKAACYQHLEYSGCGTVGLGSVDLAEVFRRNYGGLFSKGFEEAQFQAKQLTIPISHAILLPCVNDSARRQVNGMNEDVIKAQGKRLGLPEDDIGKLVGLHNETLMNADEVRKRILEARPYMERVFKTWTDSSMSQFTLTSVGISIGHANVKKNLGEFTNLAIWIN
jgi:hypothetical protein